MQPTVLKAAQPPRHGNGFLCIRHRVGRWLGNGGRIEGFKQFTDARVAYAVSAGTKPAARLRR